jgi:hypothetical protein
MINCSEINLKKIKEAIKRGEKIVLSDMDEFCDKKLKTIYLSYGELSAKIMNEKITIDEAKKIFKSLNKELTDYKSM